MPTADGRTIKTQAILDVGLLFLPFSSIVPEPARRRWRYCCLRCGTYRLLPFSKRSNSVRSSSGGLSMFRGWLRIFAVRKLIIVIASNKDGRESPRGSSEKAPHRLRHFCAKQEPSFVPTRSKPAPSKAARRSASSSMPRETAQRDSLSNAQIAILFSVARLSSLS